MLTNKQQAAHSPAAPAAECTQPPGRCCHKNPQRAAGFYLESPPSAILKASSSPISPRHLQTIPCSAHRRPHRSAVLPFQALLRKIHHGEVHREQLAVPNRSHPPHKYPTGRLAAVPAANRRPLRCTALPQPSQGERHKPSPQPLPRPTDPPPPRRPNSPGSRGDVPAADGEGLIFISSVWRMKRAINERLRRSARDNSAARWQAARGESCHRGARTATRSTAGTAATCSAPPAPLTCKGQCQGTAILVAKPAPRASPPRPELQLCSGQAKATAPPSLPGPAAGRPKPLTQCQGCSTPPIVSQ